jgi:hypothetical protein
MLSHIYHNLTISVRFFNCIHLSVVHLSKIMALQKLLYVTEGGICCKQCHLCSLQISGGNYFPSIVDGWEFHVYYLPIKSALQRTGHKLK